MREGVGGVTELMKNRMVIPFDGSHKEFKHVIYHELVHVFINDGVYGGSLKNLINSNVVRIPLWMNEGLAEYLASKWDANSDMWIRDIALNYEQLPKINSLGGYLAYRGGQSVWKFIVFKHNEHQIEEAKTMAKSLGINNFRIITSIKGFDPNYDKNLMPSEKYRSTEEKTRSLIMEGKAPEKMSPQCLKHGKVKDFIFISAFGDFYPCCYIGTYLIAYKTMWNPRNKKYNIKNKKIKDILTDKDVVNFYESTKRLETANNYCKIFCGDLNG